MKEKFPSILVGVILTAIVLWFQLSDNDLIRQGLKRLDYIAYDLRMKATMGENEPDPRVIIVDIDEHSLKEEGHWPWPRNRLADLVDRLFELGAVVVAFDVVFPEAERNSAEQVIERMKQNQLDSESVVDRLENNIALFDNNLRFAESLQDREVVLGYILHYRDDEPVGALPAPLELTNPEAAEEATVITAVSYTGNIEALTEASGFGGFFSLAPDPDGIIRRTPLIARYDGNIYPSLALEATRLFFLYDEIELLTAPIGEVEGVEAVQMGDRYIPTDIEGQALIPYRGTQGSFPYIPAADVLKGNVDTATVPFAGSIVLIGTTAQGLFDLRATPVQSVYPGVEAHANVISGILDNRFPVEPSWAAGANFAITLIAGLALSFALPFMTSLWMVVFTTVLVVGVISLNFSLWVSDGIILSVALPLMVIAVVSVFNIVNGYLQESRGRKQLMGMFGQYVPPELVAEMNRNTDKAYGFEGETRDMSVLFCDIRGFTTLSETLSASKLKRFLNDFFTPMTRLIFENRGTIDKYVGDMIMAFWGAPVEDEQHAIHAISTAMAMLEESERLSAAFVEQGLPEARIGIGINTGLMNVGDMGSEYRRAYTVLGDSVNLASRLEGTTKFYGVGLVVGEETRQQAAHVFLFRELDLVKVKGKAQAIRVYEPLCRTEEANESVFEELMGYDYALGLYRERKWEEAHQAFREMQEKWSEKRIYQLYIERIELLSQNDPGEEWDGVYERKEK